LLGGLHVGLAYGGAACLQHYVIRATLVHVTAAPRQYEKFLEAMTHRLLLRRSGSAYLFPHRLLRDHFAKAHSDPTLGTRNLGTGR
jgi:hypothetical protein